MRERDSTEPSQHERSLYSCANKFEAMLADIMGPEYYYSLTGEHLTLQDEAFGVWQGLHDGQIFFSVKDFVGPQKFKGFKLLRMMEEMKQQVNVNNTTYTLFPAFEIIGIHIDSNIKPEDLDPNSVSVQRMIESVFHYHMDSLVFDPINLGGKDGVYNLFSQVTYDLSGIPKTVTDQSEYVDEIKRHTQNHYSRLLQSFEVPIVMGRLTPSSLPILDIQFPHLTEYPLPHTPP